MKYKLDMDQMAEAEAVIEQIIEDPDTISFELVWRRHEMARIAGLLRRWKNGGTMISQLGSEIEEFISANVRDHRWLPVARLVPTERSGVSTRRDAGSHSVDRIVRMFCLLTDPAPAGKDFGDGSDSGGLGKWHLIEVYLIGVCVIARGGIKPKPRFDGKEYICARLTPLQWIRGKSCPLRLG